MIRVGITGGIASGKSLVSDYLSEMGANVICADDVTHKLYLPDGKGSKAIKKTFGKQYLNEDGSVNRSALGKHVFSDKKALNTLNKIIHPLVFEEITNQENEKEGVVFIDAALLIESGLYKDMDEIWLVVATRHERIIRLKKRDSIDEQEIEKIINAQMDDIEKAKYADRIIDNSFSKMETYHQVKRLYLALKLELSGYGVK